MKDNKILKREDIIFSKEFKVEMILNENYNEMLYNINSYFASLLLDIRAEKKLGYSFYNNLISTTNIVYKEDINLTINIIESKEDIKYLESLILKEIVYDDILDIFCKNTLKEYKMVEKELRIYIEIISSVIVDKIK